MFLTLRRSSRGPTALKRSGRRSCQTFGGSITWSSTEMMRGISGAIFGGYSRSADEDLVTSEAWVDVVEYLWRVGANDYSGATDLLDAAIDRDGVGAINDALADVCRALMDQVLFPAGTI